MQKLKMSFFHLLESLFTCFLKDKTLHNHWDYAGFTVPYYNIPSNNRELQPSLILSGTSLNYNIPSNNRELQHAVHIHHDRSIITYQVITENYTPGLGLTGKAAKSTPFLCNHFAPHFAIKSLGSSPNNPITTQSEPFGFS